MPFLGTLDVRLVSEHGPDNSAVWVTLAPFAYCSPKSGKAVTVPAGFTTDFCSVPRIPFAYELLGSVAYQAGVVHDFLYSSAEVSRAEADAMLMEMVIELGYEADKAAAIWAAVRIAGASRYTELSNTP